MTHTSLVFYSSRLVRLPHAMGAKVKLHGIKKGCGHLTIVGNPCNLHNNLYNGYCNTCEH